MRVVLHARRTSADRPLVAVEELRWWYLVAAGLVGLLAATVAYRFFHNSRHPGRVSLCFLGFGIAMVWILMIVNEVVGVLLVCLLIRPVRKSLACSRART